jgi:hypothetical protein
MVPKNPQLTAFDNSLVNLPSDCSAGYLALRSVYYSPMSIQNSSISQYFSGVTLGDIFALNLLLGLVVVLFLGLIHGHQR